MGRPEVLPEAASPPDLVRSVVAARRARRGRREAFRDARSRRRPPSPLRAEMMEAAPLALLRPLEYPRSRPGHVTSRVSR